MAATYAALSDVQARLPGRTFSATSKPTIAQVEAWLEEAEAMVLGSIRAAQIAVPGVADDGAKIIRSWMVDYAEGHTRQAHAAGAGVNASDDGKDMVDAFRELLVNVRRYGSDYGPMLANGAATGAVAIRAPNTDQAADDYIAPQFTHETVF